MWCGPLSRMYCAEREAANFYCGASVRRTVIVHGGSFESVKNSDKAKKGEIAALCDLNAPLAEKRAPTRHFFLRHPPSFFPMSLLVPRKSAIGKIKRDIGRNKREIISTERGKVSTERALVFAKRDNFSKKIAKTTSRGGLFSHLKAGVAPPKESPSKSLRT